MSIAHGIQAQSSTPALPLDLDGIAARLAHSPYQGYAYSYPHKLAYRPLEPRISLTEAWRDEPRNQIGLYVHVPFCEMRCGFCNLFTKANPKTDIVDAYLDALERQVIAVADTIGSVQARSLTIGGGTPTYLAPHQLERMFGILGRHLSYSASAVPTAVETSPMTATVDRLKFFEALGINRISIGAQSFIESETRALGRPQKPDALVEALDRIRSQSFDCLNIDLIYGAPGQTVESLKLSLRTALKWQPDELFLYPLYVRQLTGLDGRAETHDDDRVALYRAGRELLLSEGYEQVSMRMFRRLESSATKSVTAIGSPEGEAGRRDDALLGLGCGARSRTSKLHYSTDYAVGRRGVTRIVDAYCATSAEAFRFADYGIKLDKVEQMRRTVIRSVLTSDGLDLAAFAARFGLAAVDALPELHQLQQLGMLERAQDLLIPTPKGLAHADAIGPLLYSRAVQARMEAHTLQ